MSARSSDHEDMGVQRMWRWGSSLLTRFSVTSEHCHNTSSETTQSLSNGLRGDSNGRVSRNLTRDSRASSLTCLQTLEHRQSRTGDRSGVRGPLWRRWCASNHRDRSMSGDIETSQAELDVTALEGFLVGNQDL